MSRKILIAASVILILAGASFWWSAQPQPLANASAPAVTAAQAENLSNFDTLRQLAQHHCTKLQATEVVTACVEQLMADAKSNKLEPQKTTFVAESCVDITDPAEQHACHARLGHDFAVSTGDIARCDVIPVADIKASCQKSIIVNEVKLLYQLEAAMSAGAE